MQGRGGLVAPGSSPPSPQRALGPLSGPPMRLRAIPSVLPCTGDIWGGPSLPAKVLPCRVR